jgi:hypothetical protein
MPTQKIRRQFFSGVPGPLVGLQQEPIIMQRAPTTSDAAELGTIWIFPTSNGIYILSSETNAAGVVSNNWQNISGGAGVFTSLTVNPGPTNLSTVGSGTVTIGNTANADAINLESGTGGLFLIGNAHSIHIGDDAGNANTITIGNSTANTSLDLTAGTNFGIAIASGGAISMVEATATAASPTATVTINERAGLATFTGFTTAAAGTQAFTITNSNATVTSGISVTVLNEGTNDAQMTLTRVERLVGSFVVTVLNNGAAALNGNLSIDFWVKN